MAFTVQKSLQLEQLGDVKRNRILDRWDQAQQDTLSPRVAYGGGGGGGGGGHI